MLIVQHRVNDSLTLAQTPGEYGIEIDIRSDERGLYLSHDPYLPGQRLSEFLESYSHRLIVLNVKEEGLEPKVEELLELHGASDYFFLDQSIPFLVKRGIRGLTKQAARISEYESIESLRLIANFCQWAWIDFFHVPNLRPDQISEIQSLGLKVCLVSPELHSMERQAEAYELAAQVKRLELKIEAVCTKLPDIWKS
jgi:hypothetical protein